MQPPNRTKDRRPATKARTFVQANGALLAEQVVTEYQQTSYEILRFVHQDGSGTGVQQTLADGTLALPNGRTAEYDAMGRNVADPGPYVMLNTELPSENGSGIDLFGNGEGYRPGRVTYKFEGMVVPESFARQFIESGQIGGAFGLLEMAVRMSVRYEVDDHWGNTVYSGSNWGEAARLARRTETLTVYRTFIDSSWSIISLLVPQTAGDPDLRPFEEKWKKESVKNALDQALKFTEKKKCDEALKEHGIPSLRALVSKYLEAGGWENHIFDGRNKNITTQGASGYVSLGKDPATVPAFVVRRGTPNVQTGLNSQFFNITTMPSVARAIILLHEAVHHFGNKGDTDFGRTSSEGSQKITKAIVDNCHPVAGVLVRELKGI